jgi:hypothetical protein
MSQYFKLYKAFISSPGDVNKERDFTEEVINKINESAGDTLKTHIKVVRWEKLPPEYSEESIQENLNKLIKGCHFFILILNKRYGTIEKGHTKSNTEREIDAILLEKIKEPQKIILSYFRKSTQNPDKGPQETQVLDLKRRISDLQFIYKEYKDPNDFKTQFTNDLYNLLLRIELAPQKKVVLQKFWDLGKLERHMIPKLSIIYPPVPRDMMAGVEETEFWETRLAPNIFFEDFKALQKIKKSLEFIGFSNYGIYTNSGIPSNIKTHNSLYICLPRQHRALIELNKYSKIRRFSFTERKGNQHSVIKWLADGGKQIVIHSPLSKYLKIQRSKMEDCFEWNHQLGNVYAKDFAVIARFDNPESENHMVNTTLKEYFISGIRGLGTWGASWFIDNKYKVFSNIKDSSIQLLLEVTYKNESIEDVKDVSNYPEEYFINEMKHTTIKENILNNMGQNAL